MPKLGNKIIGSKDTTPIGKALFVHKVTRRAMMPSRTQTLKEALR